MKVALVQDWFVVNGGAEKVVKEIVELYPECDVFSLVDFLEEKDRDFILKGKKAKTSFIQKLPFAKKLYRNYLPLFPTAIESLDFSGYDLIISSSYAVAKGLKKNKNQIHICYCHSPIRYAWDLEDEYFDKTFFLKRIFIKRVLNYIRKWDVKSSSRVDLFIANSNYIAERIKRIYNRDSVVIYPPIDTINFKPLKEKSDYYYTSNRMVAYKKTDLIVQAFNQLPHLKLIVSGDGPEFENLKKMRSSENITFTGFLNKNELISYMQKAKAFVLAANEDFGITSIEAQSCYTPVIAFQKGGYLETVVNEKTGLFFQEQTVESLKASIEKFEKENYQFKDDDFSNNVHKFSISNFRTKLQQTINDYVKTKHS